jgi:hypothetical protein
MYRDNHDGSFSMSKAYKKTFFFLVELGISKVVKNVLEGIKRVMFQKVCNVVCEYYICF